MSNLENKGMYKIFYTFVMRKSKLTLMICVTIIELEIPIYFFA